AAHDLIARTFTDLVHGNGPLEGKPSRFGATQFLEMPAAAERIADIMRVGANVKAFAAVDGEIEFRHRDPIDAVAIDVNKARFAFHHLALPGQLIKWHAA